MKFRALIIFTVFVLLISAAGAVLPVNGEVGLYDKMIRLHVIANSDGDEDQQLKLKVRDAALEYAASLTGDCADIAEAKKRIEEHKDELTEVCRAAVIENGFDYNVEIKLGYEKYPEKTYGDFTLPSGDYYSVRVFIGEAEGHNWWCVLFPPLCVGAATGERAVMASAGLTKDEVDIMTENDGGGYVIKFKIVEFLRGIFTSK